MSEQVLNILKMFLLGFMYLFMFRVVRAVWVEIGPPRTDDRSSRKRADKGPTATRPARRSRMVPTELVVVEPEATRGRRYKLGDEITVGRAAGCQVIVDDTYVSQLHARIFSRDNQFMIEDLGSTNGTYLNRAKVAGPMLLTRGDRVQVGGTVLEVV